jgi:ATP-binding cassette subfamily F protein 3
MFNGNYDYYLEKKEEAHRKADLEAKRLEQERKEKAKREKKKQKQREKKLAKLK